MAAISTTPCFAAARPIADSPGELSDRSDPGNSARIEPSRLVDGAPQRGQPRLDPVVWAWVLDAAVSSDPPSEAQAGGAQPGENEPSPEEVARSLQLKFPDPILEEVDVSPGEGRMFADLRNLRDEISAMQRPTVRAVIRYSTQSDDLDIRQEEVSQDFYFKHGRSRLGMGVVAINYKPVLDAINVYGASLNGHHRINDFSELTGEVRFNHVTGRFLKYDTVTYDVYATLKPSDEFRIDLDVNRRIFDNIASLRRNISAVSYGGSVDYTPSSSMRFTARLAISDFSDGNWRRTGELEALVRVASSPSVEVGFRGTNFHFRQLLDNGYFNPRDYVSGEALVRLRAPLNERLNIDFTGSAGVENADPGGSKPLVKAAFRLSYKLSDRWSFDSELSYFSSRSSSSSGFARTSGLIGLKYHF